MIQFCGLFTPVATPFVRGVPDESGLAGTIRHWMETGLRGIVVLGSNGEAAHLEDHEADRLVEVARSAVPLDRVLMAGTGRDGTKATIEATRRAAKSGVDAVLVRTPAFFKGQMTPDAFVRQYQLSADASPVPVLLYNVQAHTGVSLTPATVERLAQHPNIVGIKESGGDIGQIAELVSRTPDGFAVLAGSATTFFPALCVGAAGGVLALAGLVPDLCFRLMTLVTEGRLAEARALQRRLNPLARSVGSTYGVPGIKAALDLVGLAGGAPREPLTPAPPAVVGEIRQQLVALGLSVRG